MDRQHQLSSKIKAISSALYVLLASTLILFFVSRSSPYYALNNWDDANTFFTIGKAFIRGQVLYRDVIDQKGCYLFLIYGLASLITDRSFLGVWILEILAAAVTIGVTIRILSLWCSKATSYLFAPLALVCMYASRSFYWGGSAEEFCIPLMMISLWLLLKTSKLQAKYPTKVRREKEIKTTDAIDTNKDKIDRIGNGNAITKPQIPDELTDLSMKEVPNLCRNSLDIIFVLSGICAGIAANIKFTFLGFFAAVFVYQFLISAGIIRNFRRQIRLILLYVLGALVTVLPWLIYFLAHHAVTNWYYYYIYINIFQYSNLGQPISLSTRLDVLAHILYWQFRTNPGYAVPSLIGILGTGAFGRKLLRFSRLIATFPLVGFLLTFLGIYVGGQELPYYPLPLSVFCITFFAMVGAAMEKNRCILASKSQPGQKAITINLLQQNHLAISLLAVICVLISAFLIQTQSLNPRFHTYRKQDLFQFSFASTIRESGISHPTLLNYDCLDQGLFTIADIYPNTPYFMNLNLSEQDREQQQNLIFEGYTDFVLCRDAIPTQAEAQYLVVASRYQNTDPVPHQFYLLQKKSTTLPSHPPCAIPGFYSPAASHLP